MNTGRKVSSLTTSATWGFQKIAVAYQLHSAVEGSSTVSPTGAFTRSSSFLVAWIVNTDHQSGRSRPRSRCYHRC